jgi:hypothetical protein
MSTSESFTPALQRKLAELELFPQGRFAGDGIVLCAGGSRLFTCVWVLLKHLRCRLDCRLPIEIWHIGPEEIGPPMRSILEELGDVTVVDALEVAQSYVIHDQKDDRVQYLNHTATLVLEYCNGEMTASKIAELLQLAYELSEPPIEEVTDCLTKLRSEGLIT